MKGPALCKFCGCEVTEVGKDGVCPRCEVIVAEGRTARRRMIPMEACPWLTAKLELVDVYGDPKHHDELPPGERGSCPWCSGWGEAERKLFDQARGGA